MKNFCSLAMRIGGLIFGSGLFIAAVAWTVVQVSMFWLEPYDADQQFKFLTPVLATGGALMGIGLQGMAIVLVLRCAAGAFRYAGLLVGLKDPAVAT